MNPTPDSTLDDPQQTIADLKRQLAESNAERNEAQAQKAAIAEILEIINCSPGSRADIRRDFGAGAHTVRGHSGLLACP